MAHKLVCTDGVHAILMLSRASSQAFESSHAVLTNNTIYCGWGAGKDLQHLRKSLAPWQVKKKPKIRPELTFTLTHTMPL